MIKAMSPDELWAVKLDIPDFVIQAVNDLLVEMKKSEPTKRVFIIKQDTLVNRILNEHPNLQRSEVFDKGWLNFEHLYRAEGWQVEYNKNFREEQGAEFWFRAVGATRG